MNNHSRHVQQAERQPHLFGAHAHQYRQGIAVGDGNNPPPWCPELAHDREYPYTLAEWKRDLRRWQAATKVPPHRQGPSVALAVGGAARTVIDDVEEEILINGVVADFHDGAGDVIRSGVAALIRVLELKFPTNTEALMLQAGLDFSRFAPARGNTGRCCSSGSTPCLPGRTTLRNYRFRIPSEVGCSSVSSACRRASGRTS